MTGGGLVSALTAHERRTARPAGRQAAARTSMGGFKGEFVFSLTSVSLTETGQTESQQQQS